jgi:sialic acid synthase SpsE
MNKVYVIAEAGVNHGGAMAVAREMVAQAAAAGVDAVKFQSFTADGLTHAQLAADQHAFFAQFELSRAEHVELAGLCREYGVDFLSTPFDFGMADLLSELGVPAFKIASCDLTNLPLIRHCAAYGKPLYISTGMGDQAEARIALEAAERAGAPRVVLLQCTTNYPTAYPDVNLRALEALSSSGPCAAALHTPSADGDTEAAATPCEVGFSDHSIGNWCCFGAVALGAVVIEKHFCLDKSVPGPDIACSCDPPELAELVRGIRALELALGEPNKQMLPSEREIARIARRGVYYAGDLPAGHTLTPADLRFLRPASSLSPAAAAELLGRSLKRPVTAGIAADLSHLAG